MSILGHTISLKLVGTIVVLLAAGALLPVMSQTPSHEITLVTRGMKFYLAADLATPNPTLRVHAGERVRIVLRNEDRGMTHDFAVPAVKVGMDLVNSNQSDDVVFDAPRERGTYHYICRPHQLMMYGEIIVE